MENYLIKGASHCKKHVLSDRGLSEEEAEVGIESAFMKTDRFTTSLYHDFQVEIVCNA